MSTDSKDALERLIKALQAHYVAAQKSEDPDDSAVVAAESELQDAFFTYDTVLFDSFGVELPFDIMMEEDEDSDIIYDSFGYDDEEEEDDSEDFDEYDLYDDDDDDEDDELYFELEENDESKH